MTQREDLDWAIKVENLSKTFKLPHEKHTSLKSIFINGFRGKSFELQKAVDDVSFEVKRGEFFGIVGRNGSGKSTLLKCIAGVYPPTRGKIKINGSLVPFIELGVGFNPELTGRDNVFLNGALLGFSRPEVEAMYDEIVEFAELEDFMDQKLKNYSSGMQVRLAFSIAIRAETDILLLDEVLAVGDSAFQQKCFDYFQGLKISKTTVILVSHDRALLERFCRRGALVNKGKLLDVGPIEDVLKSYSEIVVGEIEKGARQKRKVKLRNNKKSDNYAKIVSASTYGSDNKKKKFFSPGEQIFVKFNANIIRQIKNPVMGITIWHKNIDAPVFAHNTLLDNNKNTGVFKPGTVIKFKLELPDVINNGEYYLEPAIANESTTVVYDQKPKAATFFIYGGNNPHSIIVSERKIHIETENKISDKKDF